MSIAEKHRYSPQGLMITIVLQDPSVANAPIDQRIAFLRSKNLTQDEIDASLARVGQSPAPQSQPPANYPPQQYRQQPPPQQYGYQQQQQPPPYWAQPPPEPPQRDWRDWFIMATVVGGVGYGMYWTARRYIYPLIAPPTPPQLEQDKASVDASFDKAFALLDQLATDTAELKDSEKARTERLDSALAEVESVIGRMKEANENREQEAKRMARELNEIREQIPKAIEREKEMVDGRLKDLAGEMKSLKTLVGNRMQQQPAPPAAPTSQQQMAGRGVPATYTPSAPAVNGVGMAGVTSSPAPSAPTAQPAPQTNGTSASGMANGTPSETPRVDGAEIGKPTSTAPASASVLPERSASASPFGGRTLGGKAQIPSWQLAAKRRNEEAAAKKDGVASGTSTPSTSATSAASQQSQPQQSVDTSESGTAQEAGA